MPPAPDGHGRRCDCTACSIARAPEAYARGVARGARGRLHLGRPKSRKMPGVAFGMTGWQIAPVSYEDVQHWPKHALTTGPGDRGFVAWAE